MTWVGLVVEGVKQAPSALGMHPYRPEGFRGFVVAFMPEGWAQDGAGLARFRLSLNILLRNSRRVGGELRPQTGWFLW